jgi:hypothetical protein
LEDLASHQKRSQFSKALLPGPSNPDQHRISSRLAEDARYPKYMVQCIIKEHQIQSVVGRKNVLILLVLQGFDDDLTFLGNFFVVYVGCFEFEDI